MENIPDSFPPEKPDLSKTGDKLSKDSQELKDKASQVGQDVKDHASATVEYASAVTKEKVTDGFNALSDYIKANPLTSVVAALSLGYVLGWFRNK